MEDKEGVSTESLSEIISELEILRFLRNLPKRYPKKFKCLVITVVIYSVLTHIVIPRSLKLATDGFAAEYHLQIDSGDWSIRWFGLKIINHGFKLYAKGSELPVLEIDKASLRFGLFALVWNGWKGSLRSLYVKQPKLRLSYDVNGNSNWESIAEDKAVINALAKGKKVIEALSGEEPGVFLREVRFENMRIDWSRQNADLSGASVYNKSVSELYIEDANLVVKNFEWPIDAANDDERKDDQSLHFDGRLAGGKVTFDIEGDLSIWRQEETSSEFIPVTAAVWRPEGLAKVTFEGVGADALWHIMPSNGLVVRTGRVSGETRFLIHEESILKISSNLIFDRVGISLVKSDDQGLGLQVIDDKVYTATGPNQCSFSGNLSDPEFHPVPLIISLSIEKSVDSENEKELSIEAAKNTRNYQKGIDQESQKKIEQDRPSYVQRAIGAAVGGYVTEKLRDKIGITASSTVGGLTSEAVNGKSTKVGKFFRNLFGGKKKSG